jgi:hypothetical protein
MIQRSHEMNKINKIRCSVRRMPLFWFFKELQQRHKYNTWMRKGKPVPPPDIVKQQKLVELKRRYNIDTFIETGTYFGDTTYAVRNYFKSIFTIEIQDQFFLEAKKRFQYSPHIKVVHGNSRDKLGGLSKNIGERILFWLDGHYNNSYESPENKITPIVEELEIILNHGIKDHIILIDDARLFIGTNGYPALEDLRKFVFEKSKNANIQIEHDMILIHFT